VPSDVEPREMPYVRQLLDAYGERDGCAYSGALLKSGTEFRLDTVVRIHEHPEASRPGQQLAY
jgi:hypothetical protein